MTSENNFDVIVIGGGPAGMMAAIKAGQLKKRVALLEKNATLGSKLLLTGGHRCNITNATFNAKEMAEKYGKEGLFLLNSLSIFGAKETIEFFNKNGVKTKIEKENKVYCATDKSSDVLKSLIYLLRNNEVQVITSAKVKEILQEKNKISKIILNNNKELIAKNYILTTGGMSYPETGSTGDGYEFAKNLGHKVEIPKPALVPIKIKEEWVKKAQGLSLPDAKLDVFSNNKKIFSVSGEIIFTHFGLSGPAILSISERVGRLLEKGQVKIFLDLNSDLSPEDLDKIIQKYFNENAKKSVKNCLTDILPTKLIPIILDLLKIESSKNANTTTKEERLKIVSIIKKIEMTPTELLGFDQAIITSGGVLLKEIDAKTMKSKIVKNLFFAGEVINLHGPTGGYNLQICWSTGNLAGQSAT
jgi:hypothetical protein